MPDIAVVIPAHNEEAVIVRCLESVLRDATPEEFSVLVVSNGSTDGTVAAATSYAQASPHEIEVLDLPTPSKIAALRAADEYLSGRTQQVRLFLDADVELTTAAARHLAGALDSAEPRLALARIAMDTSASSWPVRQYYRAWYQTGYIQRQEAGSGVFAVNEAGAERIGPLPDIINDDQYVARRFTSAERIVCEDTFVAHACLTARALVRRRARTVNGTLQLDRQFVSEEVERESTASDTLADLLTAVRERRLPATAAASYLTITLAARLLARGRRVRGTAGDWSTDETSRRLRPQE